MPENHNKKWYVVQVYSGTEKKTVALVKDRIETSGLADSFGEVIVPSEEVLDVCNGKKQKTERFFFSGYIFIFMEMKDETWHLIKGLPNIFSFLGNSSKEPIPLSQEEIDNILNRVSSRKDQPIPKIMYETGEVVRIIDGPFSDFDAVIEDVNYVKALVKVGVTIFGRQTPLELSFNQIMKIH